MLNDVQEAFCWEYVSNGYNAIEAYKATHPGCANGSARNGSYRYMNNLEVKKFLNELIQGIYQQKNITAATIATELSEVAFQRRELMGDNYNEHTKLKALELLQKQMGLQTTNQKVEAKVEQVVFVGEEELED